MILNWKRDCTKGIPDLATGRSVILTPGYNQVSNDIWKRVRPHVVDLIERKLIEEEWTKVKFSEGRTSPLIMLNDELVEDGKDYPATTEVLVPATLKDMRASTRLTAMIKETLNKPTLKEWLEIETRDEVRLAIRQQISYINNPKQKIEE